MNVVCLSIYLDRLEFLSSVPWGFHHRCLAHICTTEYIFMVPISFKKWFISSGNAPFFALWCSQWFHRVVYLLHCFVPCSDRLWRLCLASQCSWRVGGCGSVRTWNCYRCLLYLASVGPVCLLTLENAPSIGQFENSRHKGSHLHGLNVCVQDCSGNSGKVTYHPSEGSRDRLLMLLLTELRWQWGR